MAGLFETLGANFRNFLGSEPAKKAIASASVADAGRKALNMVAPGSMQAIDFARGVTFGAPAATTMGASVAQPARKPQPKAQYDALAPELPERYRAYREAVTPETHAASQAPTFDNIIRQIAAAQGGQVSLRQLGAVADIAQRTTPKAAKPPRPSDAAAERLKTYYDQRFQQRLEQGADPREAEDEWVRSYESLVKVDPFAGYMSGSLYPDEEQ